MRSTAVTVLRRVPPLYRLAITGRAVVRRALRPAEAREVTPGELRQAVRDLARVTVVQIGANDGKSNDPIFPLASTDPRWHGLLVEPVPFIFARLRAHYGDAPRFQYANVAVATEAGTVPFYHVAEDARAVRPDLPEWVDQIGSFTRAHVADCLSSHGALAQLVVTTVPTVTLPDLLRDSGVTAIDVFLVDAEGHDYKILSQLDLTRYRPRIILYEHRSLTPEEQSAATAMLHAAGYHTTRRGPDTLATPLHSRL